LTQIPEEQNGAGSCVGVQRAEPAVGASAAADAVLLHDAHRTHADFRIRVLKLLRSSRQRKAVTCCRFGEKGGGVIREASAMMAEQPSIIA
jgi:hypothetical protein